MKEKPPKDMWSGGRLTKIQATTRPDDVWPEVRTKIGEAAQNRENKNGKTRSQSSTMLEKTKEFTLLILMTKITKKFSKMRGEDWKDRKLERPMAPATPCKRLPNGITKATAKPKLDPRRIPKQCMVAQWNLLNPEGND